MDGEQNQQPATPTDSDRIAKLEAEIVRLKTNPRDLPVRVHCNVCGVDVKDGERCERHPNDKLNHVREDDVLAKQV
jgi:hypothetical protein